MTPFDRGTMVAAKHAAERTKAKKLISVAGGGDTVAALNQAGVAGDFSYVSTAGGAFLEWMEGKPLPGVEVLKVWGLQLLVGCCSYGSPPSRGRRGSGFHASRSTGFPDVGLTSPPASTNPFRR